MYAGNMAFGLHCGNMAFRQIHYMNIVTHTRAVRSRIIIAEYGKKRQFPAGHLADIRQKVIRNPIRVLAD